MAINSKAQLNNELDSIEKVINAMALSDDDRTNLLGILGNIRSRSDELANSATKALLLSDVESLKTQIINSFDALRHVTNLSQYQYAMSSSELLNMSRAIIDYNTAAASQKFEKLKEYLEKYETMASILKSKGLAKDNLDVNVGTMSRHNQRRFNHALYEVASNATTELNRLKDELANAHDDVDIERIVQKIDEQLARLNSTNRTLQRLRRKVGNIEPHQRSIQMKSVDIARLRNQKVADELYESPYISEKLGNLTAAYERERNASTASELYQAKKEVKKAEREIYGKRLTKRRARKIDKQFEKRKAVIARAQSVQVENNHE